MNNFQGLSWKVLINSALRQHTPTTNQLDVQCLAVTSTSCLSSSSEITLTRITVMEISGNQENLLNSPFLLSLSKYLESASNQSNKQPHSLVFDSEGHIPDLRLSMVAGEVDHDMVMANDVIRGEVLGHDCVLVDDLVVVGLQSEVWRMFLKSF